MEPKYGRLSVDDPNYWSQFDDHMRLNVVGESYRQAEIMRATGAPSEGDFRHECTACLIPDPRNPHDRFAIRVEIEGEHVGFLPRGSARRYHRRLKAILARGESVTCYAFVGRGDWNPNLGVSLRMPYGHELIGPRRERPIAPYVP